MQQLKVTPKPQVITKRHTVTNASHVQTLHKNATVTNASHVQTLHKTATPHNNNLSKAPLRTLPAVQPNKLAVQNFHSQHLNFHAKPNPAIVSVKFNQNYHIQGSQNWKGQNYAVFRSYHPAWHNQGWWHSHYNHVFLFGGGWYYWNAGYYYPAWGYDSAAAYYPYDGPIYVGANAAPLDQVIADVQSSLQQQGYYTGEVDGLLGPLTRAALADYQAAHGLELTSAIDEPTLDSLGMAS